MTIRCAPIKGYCRQVNTDALIAEIGAAGK